MSFMHKSESPWFYDSVCIPVNRPEGLIISLNQTFKWAVLKKIAFLTYLGERISGMKPQNYSNHLIWSDSTSSLDI